jgi:hypothetical protein
MHAAAESYFERFLNPGSILEAEKELVALGEDAIPLLELLFSGLAKNHFGVPYRQLGLPVDCGIHVALQLGSMAKPLERHLRLELRNGNPYAATALGGLGSLEQQSVTELASALTKDLNIATESAAALIRCGQITNAAVVKVVAISAMASAAIQRAISKS